MIGLQNNNNSSSRTLFLLLLILIGGAIVSISSKSVPSINSNNNNYLINDDNNNNNNNSNNEYDDDDDNDDNVDDNNRTTNINKNGSNFDQSLLDVFLSSYYDKYTINENSNNSISSSSNNNNNNDNELVLKNINNKVKSDKHVSNNNSLEENNREERMQGDQPMPENPANNNNNNINNIANYLLNATDSGVTHNMTIDQNNLTDIGYLRQTRNRSKENWMQTIKENILRHVGRSNMTTTPKMDTGTILNGTILNDDHITEKIRSYYPSCDIPSNNTDQDMWKDENVMNLYFNFSYASGDEKNTNIATATLRLYRLPNAQQQHDGRNATASGGVDSVIPSKVHATSTASSSKLPECESTNSTDDEKLLRVSIYWYTKSLRKRRVKRRLSDSKVISEQVRWVELSVKPATRAWSRGRNLGLALLVEDQEGNTLKADRYFKGATCMVGASTPKPIPTIIIDAARKTNELDRIQSLFRGGSTLAISGDVPLLPSIDICTLEFPENYTLPAHHHQNLKNLRVNACNLRQMHEQSERLIEREKVERFAMLPDLLIPPTRHIRHQRQL